MSGENDSGKRLTQRQKEREIAVMLRERRGSMTKDEMYFHYQSYHEKMEVAQTAENEGRYKEAVDAAISALGNIDGMVQYTKKYVPTTEIRLDAINMILNISSLLLDTKRLSKLEPFLRDYKRIARKSESSTDLAAALEKSRAGAWLNHRLWCIIDSRPGIRQSDLAGIMKPSAAELLDIQNTIESWEKMGLVRKQKNGELSLATRINAVVSGKCPSCGKSSSAPKSVFFGNTKCLYCKKTSTFCIVS